MVSEGDYPGAVGCVTPTDPQSTVTSRWIAAGRSNSDRRSSRQTIRAPLAASGSLTAAHSVAPAPQIRDAGAVTHTRVPSAPHCRLHRGRRARQTTNISVFGGPMASTNGPIWVSQDCPRRSCRRSWMGVDAFAEFVCLLAITSRWKPEDQPAVRVELVEKGV